MTTEQPTEAVNVQLKNVPPNDAQFLRAVIGLFCDPQYKDMAQTVRSGNRCLQYLTDGTILLIPVFIEGQNHPQPIVQHTSNKQ
jgi:hypothetical protein